MNCHSDHAHLGDLQWCLTAMSRLHGPHVLCCKPEYVQALQELVVWTDITVEDLSHVRPSSFDAWIASGAFESEGVRYRDDIDIMGFVQRYFNAMGRAAGLGEPFPTREGMLCGWPSIFKTGLGELAWLGASLFKGILVINADPKSGQCPGYSSSEMDALIQNMEAAGHSVCSIEGADLSLVQIGALSIHAKLIVGCATGPLWLCLNSWSKSVQKIIMLDPMRLDYGPGVPIVHAKNAMDVQLIMKGMGFL